MQRRICGGERPTGQSFATGFSKGGRAVAASDVYVVNAGSLWELARSVPEVVGVCTGERAESVNSSKI